MKLKELEDVIDDNASVSVQTKSNEGLPLMYDSWKDCKNSFKGAAWEEEVKLTTYAGIQIYFINI